MNKKVFFDNPLVPNDWGQDNGKPYALPKGAQQKLDVMERYA